VDFSIEYNESSEMLLSVKDSPIKDLESLTGKTIGVQLGSIQEEGAERLGEQYDFEVKKIDDGPMIIQELISNRIDVAYMDKDVAIGYLEAQDLYGFDDPTSSSPGMAVAFPKGSDLVEDVHKDRCRDFIGPVPPSLLIITELLIKRDGGTGPMKSRQRSLCYKGTCQFQQA